MTPVYLHATTSLTCQTTEPSPPESFSDPEHPFYPSFFMDQFKPHSCLAPMKLRRMDRASRMVCSAVEIMQKDRRLDNSTGLFLGTFSAGSDAVEQFLERYLKEGPLGANPMLFPNTVLNAPIGQAAIHFGWQGPNSMACQNFLAGLAALQAAVNHVLCHPHQQLVAGAVDIISPFQLKVWQAHPGYASEFVIGEGCSVAHVSMQESGVKILGFSQGRVAGTEAYSFASQPVQIREKVEAHWQRFGTPRKVWEFCPSPSFGQERFSLILPNAKPERMNVASEVGFGSFLAMHHLHLAAQIRGTHDIFAFGLGGDFLICRLQVG